MPEKVRFSQQFKNIKVFQPGIGSLKHGEIRKTDSREIQDIVTDRAQLFGKQRISIEGGKQATYRTVAARKLRSKTTL